MPNSSLAKYWLQFGTLPECVHTIKGSIYCVIGVFGVYINATVLWYLFYYPALRKTSSYFVINLVIANLFMLLITVPLSIMSSFQHRWLYGRIGCNIYGACGGIAGFVCIGTMTLMSFEKYILVKKPFFRTRPRKLITLCAIISTWIYAIILVLPIFWTENQFVLEGFMTDCTIDYLSSNFPTTVSNYVMLFVGFIIPLIVIVVSYTRLIQLIKKNHTIAKHIHDTMSSFNKRNKRFYTKRKNVYEERAMRVAIKVTIGFCIGWLPYAFITVFGSYSIFGVYIANPYSAALANLCAKLTTIHNPLLFIISYRKTTERSPITSTTSFPLQNQRLLETTI